MVKRVWPLAAIILVVGVLFVAVFPTQAWLNQRREKKALTERVELLVEQNKALAARAETLRGNDEIERIAREQYNLVRPGEEAYAILPAPEAPATTTTTKPVTTTTLP